MRTRVTFFSSLVEYCGMYVRSELYADQAYKNYDLLYRTSNRRLRAALADAGFRHDELSTALAECAARIRERGYGLAETELEQCLLEWYVWRRINSGGYRKWPYRQGCPV